MSNDPNPDFSTNIIKREAKGFENTDLGEVQEVSREYIITQKGTLNKQKFYIPKNLVDRFDGTTVYFKLTEEEAKQYKKD
ncbi:MAG TPA: DUF2171 domain-containing protein [Nitrososphaeraceae archaeon]|nr:DUF2171 domain-containing protein [Nitrososphaeraceae archaeon]